MLQNKPNPNEIFSKDTKKTFLSDGGWGSELFKLGLPVGASPERMNIENRELVAKVASSYVNAGSDIILTNSFGGNKFVLEKHDLADRTEEINVKAVEISKEAAKNSALVFASMGPTGKMVSMGEIDKGEAKAAFLQQAKAFKIAEADAVVIETMTDIEELEAALEAVVEVGLPAISSMTFDSGSLCDRTMMGVSIDDLLKTAINKGAAMIGANCGVGIEKYVNLASTLVKKSPLPVWIKANAGLPVIENGKAVYKMDATTFSGHAAQLIKLGVRVIGGCCGTNPSHIEAIRKTLG